MFLTRTCSIRCAAHKGGQHFDHSRGVCVSSQASLHLLLHPSLHLQQLLPIQTEGVEDTLALGVLLGQSVRHSGDHRCPFTAAVLRAQEAHVAVRHQGPHHLIQSPGEPSGRDREHSSVGVREERAREQRKNKYGKRERCIKGKYGEN